MFLIICQTATYEDPVAQQKSLAGEVVCCSVWYSSPLKNYAALAAVLCGLPGKSLRRGKGGTSRAGVERSWRHLSDGTPYLTTGLMEFVEMVESSSLGEAFYLFCSEYFTRRCEGIFSLPLVVLLAFSNRCLSCSDKTQSTTWLHPRTGEPVNSGHMIRSGTPQMI